MAIYFLFILILMVHLLDFRYFSIFSLLYFGFISPSESLNFYDLSYSMNEFVIMDEFQVGDFVFF